MSFFHCAYVIPYSLSPDEELVMLIKESGTGLFVAFNDPSIYFSVARLLTPFLTPMDVTVDHNFTKNPKFSEFYNLKNWLKLLSYGQNNLFYIGQQEEVKLTEVINLGECSDTAKPIVFFVPIEGNLDIGHINDAYNQIYSDGDQLKWIRIQDVESCNFNKVVKQAFEYHFESLRLIEDCIKNHIDMPSKQPNYAMIGLEHRENWAYFYEAMNIPFLLDQTDVWKSYIPQQGEYPTACELENLKGIVFPGCIDSPTDDLEYIHKTMDLIKVIFGNA